MVVEPTGFQLYKSPSADGSAATRPEGRRGPSREIRKDDGREGRRARAVVHSPHMQNFFQAIRARDYKLLHADVAVGARAAAFCHLANISYRTGRALKVDQSTGRFIGDDAANALSPAITASRTWSRSSCRLRLNLREHFLSRRALPK